KDLQQQVRYYNSLSGYAAENMMDDKQTCEAFIQGITQMQQMFAPKPDSTKDVIIPGKTAPKDSAKK
ncbi:MAG TPA: hypothetical protein DCO78_01370, partial [Chitinophagaceae bacterium]|nr:hypothetical protein [Chitinophagaceae bacterium]